MALCQICSLNPGSKAGVVKGTYYKHICQECVMGGINVSSGQAIYNRARDLENHEADVIQPDEGGLPSPRFIHLYPERARQLWSEDQINKAIRS